VSFDRAFGGSLRDGFNPNPINYFDPNYQRLAESIRQLDDEGITKALVTGSGIVADGATGGQALRMQFLDDVMTAVSFTEKHVVGIKHFPVEKAYSPTFEWTTYDGYGGTGNGFTSETGSDGAGNLNSFDDNFTRNVANIGLLATERQVSFLAQTTKNISDPVKAARTGATRELLRKANNALYFGDRLSNGLEYNGLARQMLTWCDNNPTDSPILFDAGGQPIDQGLLDDASTVNINLFGDATLLLESATAYNDSMKLLHPFQRVEMGSATGAYGVRKAEFEATGGTIQLVKDPMLRANRPLNIRGNGSDGLIRTSTTADASAPAFASTPYATANPTAGAAGAGKFWQVANKNTDSAVMSTAPALPSGDGAVGGTQTTRLAAGTYYYAVAPVYDGLEGPAWVYGASAAGTATGASGIAVTANQVVKLVMTTAAITGVGTTYATTRLKYRIYRTAVASPALSDFKLLMESATPTSGDSACWDNGFYIPGTDNAFLLTEQSQGMKALMMLQLLPLMERTLPHAALIDPFAYLWFAAPILLAARHHLWIRNVGRSN